MANQAPETFTEEFKGTPVDVAKAAPMSPPQDAADRQDSTKND